MNESGWMGKRIYFGDWQSTSQLDGQPPDHRTNGHRKQNKFIIC